MMILTGTLLAVSDRPREWQGDRWNERTLHLLDGVRTQEVTLQRGSADRPAFDESKLPESGLGNVVALEVYARGGGNKRVYYTATRAVSEHDVAEALGLLPAGK